MAAKPRRSGGGRSSRWGVLLLAVGMLGLGLGLGYALSGKRHDNSRPEGARTGQAPSGKPPKARPPAVPQETARPEQPVRPEPAPPKAPPLPASTPKEPSRPKFALVIDDLGYAAPELVTRLCAQPVPLTVAVLPFQSHTQRSAEIAFEAGKEILLHLPMEPLGYPGPSKDPGTGAILYGYSEAETRARVRAALMNVPHRKGANNHMGSRITPDRTRMTWILEEIRAKGGFFVDSRTEKDSVAFAVAEALGMRAVQRKVFLDDDKSFEAIEKQWQRALDLARKDGEVLVIGHIYPETVGALERLVPRSQDAVRFVTAGTLARPSGKGQESPAARGFK